MITILLLYETILILLLCDYHTIIHTIIHMTIILLPYYCHIITIWLTYYYYMKPYYYYVITILLSIYDYHITTILLPYNYHMITIWLLYDTILLVLCDYQIIIHMMTILLPYYCHMITIFLINIFLLFAHLHHLSSYSFSSTLLSSNLSLLSASSLLCFSYLHIVGSLTSKLPSVNIYFQDQFRDMERSFNQTLRKIAKLSEFAI